MAYRDRLASDDYTLRRSTLLWIILGAFGAYFLASAFLGGATVNEGITLLQFSFAAGTAVAYWPDFIVAVRKAHLQLKDVLAIGIFFSWTAVTGSTVVAFTWRLAGRPPDWPDHWLWSLRIVLSILGAICHLLAPHAIGGTVPTVQWVRLGCIVTAGLIAAGIAAKMIS